MNKCGWLMTFGLLARWSLTLPPALTSVGGGGGNQGWGQVSNTLLRSKNTEGLMVFQTASKYSLFPNHNKPNKQSQNGCIKTWWARFPYIGKQGWFWLSFVVFRLCCVVLLCSSVPCASSTSFASRWCLFLWVKYIFKGVSRMLTVDLFNNPYPVLRSLSRQWVKCLWKLGIQN